MNLPPAAELVRLKTERNLTYCQLSALLGASPSHICRRVIRSGHRIRAYQPRATTTAQWWQSANTAMALIRSGRTSLRSLANAMHKSHSTIFYLVRRLVDLGLVAHAGKPNTLHLTNPAAGSLIRLAQRRPDGVLEQFKGKEG